MITKQCPQCGNPMKFIKGGISKKTGNPYNSFWSCGQCKFTANIETKAVPQGQSTKQPQTVAGITQIIALLGEIRDLLKTNNAQFDEPNAQLQEQADNEINPDEIPF